MPFKLYCVDLEDYVEFASNGDGTYQVNKKISDDGREDLAEALHNLARMIYLPKCKGCTRASNF